ncbi:hypothetical protein NUU61_000572 [Penicillium alfredii]|uniref:Uncharacterized protein n=1 Tax=Penicillium alfredii TaxID=1506179 RepID=A0A9W9GAD0_9EURO|nr:uncharacterized protein NUU61_000572 [Penicillium alfredii]KAJ5114813.1 hypothetical protein NUU61_000572 [Penicillium alfredii]
MRYTILETDFLVAAFCLTLSTTSLDVEVQYLLLGSAFTQNWPQLFVCRLLLSIGMGIKASTTSVYTAENAPV